MSKHGRRVDYKRFNPADYLDDLDDLDDVAGYLAIALEGSGSGDDPTAVPRALGVSRDGLYKTLSAGGNPTWSTILKVTTALGPPVRTPQRGIRNGPPETALVTHTSAMIKLISPRERQSRR